VYAQLLLVDTSVSVSKTGWSVYPPVLQICIVKVIILPVRLVVWLAVLDIVKVGAGGGFCGFKVKV
jgi:hypothetical protein